jgi:very-short-patch-repair endonuclease
VAVSEIRSTGRRAVSAAGGHWALVVELDGETHGAQEDYDAERTRFLGSKGYRMLRFSNRDVRQNIEGVLEAITLALIPSLL